MPKSNNARETVFEQKNRDIVEFVTRRTNRKRYFTM